MSDRGLIFSAPMVRALLAGTKTQTRRVLKPQPLAGSVFDYFDHDLAYFNRLYDDCSSVCKLPWKAGDTWWCRETWIVGDHDFGIPPTAWLFEKPGQVGNEDSWWGNPPESERQKWADRFGTADTMGGTDLRTRSPLFMPRWAARITGTILNVRVERVQDISEADARAEGMRLPPLFADEPVPINDYLIKLYAALWDSLHKPPYDWASNPLVAVLELEVNK